VIFDDRAPNYKREPDKLRYSSDRRECRENLESSRVKEKING